MARETPHPKERDYLFTRLPEFARNIQEHNNRAVRIINGMLEQSRGSAGVRKPANINQTVKEAVNLAYHGDAFARRQCQHDASGAVRGRVRGTACVDPVRRSDARYLESDCECLPGRHTSMSCREGR